MRAPWHWESSIGYDELRDGDGKRLVCSDETEPAAMPLMAAAPELLETLKAIEWVKGDHDGSVVFCPMCEKLERFGHAKDCRLVTVIAKAEAAP